MPNNLPIIVQTIVYRKKGQEFEVLVLKRNEQRGGFWNVVNGTFEMNETIPDCRKRELFEEAGIQEVLHWDDETHRFSFPYKDYTIVVLVYAAEVSENQEIVINDEHTEYRWVSFDQAIQLMKFDDDKKGLRMLHERLITSKI